MIVFFWRRWGRPGGRGARVGEVGDRLWEGVFGQGSFCEHRSGGDGEVRVLDGSQIDGIRIECIWATMGTRL